MSVSARARGVSTGRLLLGAAGVAVGTYGVWLLLREPFDGLVSAVLWLGGGVIVHDGILAPLTLVVLLLGTRFLPAAARLPAALVLLVWGTVTVMAVPVLVATTAGLGRGDQNATLLDRAYGPAWWGLTVVAVVVAVVWSWRRSRKLRRVNGVSRASNTRSA
ncbi:hypothetical protein CLV56_0407 [Mumia flava]|uniref:Uncharacterized protein n=1 Tax=Mumia flava TaxID=1348852 RepID=A0A2M9BE20_9ACTN|nr:hypothetical protein [Mumia flava]PJJ56203.1 hypothetical protein CLV56_0407 [Mumia flava]